MVMTTHSALAQSSSAGSNLACYRHKVFGAIIVVSLCLFAVVAFAPRRMYENAITPDASMQLYVGQQILIGRMPYRDVIFPKTPLTGYANALAMAVVPADGLHQVLAVRWLYFSLGVICTALMFFIVQRLLKSRMAGVIAGCAWMSFTIVRVSSTTGPEPKLLMLTCSLACILATLHRRYFWAGIAGSLAFLTWQPGGIFVALSLAAALIERDRRRAMTQAVIGIAVPLLLIAMMLLVGGSLGPAIRQTVGRQLSYGARSAQESPLRRMAGNANALWRMWPAGRERKLARAALAFWCVCNAYLVHLVWRSSSRDQLVGYAMLVLSGDAMLLFTLFDLQGTPDTLPVACYLAFGIAHVMHWLDGTAVKIWKRLARGLPWLKLVSVLGLALLLLVIRPKFRASGIRSILSGQIIISRDLYAQVIRSGEVRAMHREQANGSLIQAFGDITPLVLNRWTNATPVIHLGPKHYHLVVGEFGSIETFLDQLKLADPGIVLFQRNQQRDWVAGLLDWLSEEYLAMPPPSAQQFAVYISR